LLARKIHFLRQIEENLRTTGNIQPGESVPALQAKTNDGKPVSFSYGTSETALVIYVLSPTCQWCEKNQQSVEALASSIGKKYRFIGLSLESNDLKRYLEEKNVSFPVYTEPAITTYSSYKLGNGTPQTIVVSGQGTVLKNWHGAYSGSVKSEIEQYFGVHLPEIAQ